MKSNLLKQFLIITIMIFTAYHPLYSQADERLTEKAEARLEKWQNPLSKWQHIAKPAIDSVYVVKEQEAITLYFAPGLSYYPFREDDYKLFKESFRDPLGWRFRNYSIDVITNSYSIEKLIPNYYRKELPVDSACFPVNTDIKRKTVVSRKDMIYPALGLSGNSIALWHSHGYYFEMTLDRWEWQRAKLFSTVEDIEVMGYVVPYLTRMLENAGATVWIPRERDIQTNEVIVDNDRSTGVSEFITKADTSLVVKEKGFILTDTLFTGYNPFKHGTSLRIAGDSAVYIPEIPAKGYYAVYISYPLFKDNSSEVNYSVYHTGGRTEFIVDQTIGGETWVYLGTFHFNAGKSRYNGSVTVKSNDEDKYLALDAMRFGGGMGNVARRPSSEIIRNQLSRNENASESIVKDTDDTLDFSWKLSGKPRFLEAARYWLQYAGMPDTLVYTPNNNKNDYNDDYQSRGLWVNYLKGDPYNDEYGEGSGGLGIDLDMSFAFHTDAGITPGDSTIGTLAICYTLADSGRYSDGRSRMANRELADIIQTQIVDDIRRVYNPDWTRRGLWDRAYSEARSPDVPAMLLELLSHQNLADMRYNLDPRFRYSVCRSIYKGILKYISYINNRDYVVQPLPVDGFAITPVSEKTIRLSWEAVTETDEPTSEPDKYKIYTRRGENGFNNGFVVANTVYELELPSYDSIYSFKVTALNEGGESFDSEILSVGITTENNGTVLVVNGFDRISGPAWFDIGDMAGIAWWDDRGVPYIHDIVTIGDQYDFNRHNPWLDDDSPGWGASYSDMEEKVIPGNNFDNTYIHGKAIMAAGYSFYSVSDEYFTSDTDLSQFKIIDLIFGEEKSTPFFNDSTKTDFRIYTPGFMEKIREITRRGASIFMSGSYVGSDQFSTNDSSIIKFAEETLHFFPRTGHSVKTGEVYATDYVKPDFTGRYNFNTGYSPLVYQAEAPDAIEPSGDGALCAFRYDENNSSAGVAYKGDYNTFILGFPYETILKESQRKMLMVQILNFFKK